MATKLTWLGHGCWSIETGSHHILLDPFLDDSPTAPLRADQVQADFLLISHGHFDHIADAVKIAQRTNATVVANFEICEWLKPQGVENLLAMNIGGAVELDFGRVQMTIAHHSSGLPDGTYGGNPGGFLLKIENKNLYFACDTALFLDMKLYRREGLDVAILPIGDLFTMGPDDSVEATALLEPKMVLPAHYNTWPPIEQDAVNWAQRIKAHTKSNPVVLAPGESIEV